ncbi:MAG: 4-(cytidine 5'-diphospho)-2-C-methyl-D-erythritol kinase [Chlamydiota bacterium]
MKYCKSFLRNQEGNRPLSMLELFSPAKINLFFRVLGKRSDGYHEVASLMQAISLGDKIAIRPSLVDQFSCSDPSIPCNASNLVVQAVALFRKKTGARFPVQIHIEKKIPVEAGLGGGSSNAATVLWALNACAAHPASVEQLQHWVSEISSDAPFFFSLGTAYATGRNEHIAPIDPLPAQQLVIAKPSWGMSTQQVYRHCLLTARSKRAPTDLLRAFIAGKFAAVNDLEQSAFVLRPELKKLKGQLVDLGFQSVLMTGSGSAFYCCGAVKNPDLPGVSFFPVSFVRRHRDQWFSSES